MHHRGNKGIVLENSTGSIDKHADNAFWYIELGPRQLPGHYLTGRQSLGVKIIKALEKDLGPNPKKPPTRDRYA